MNKQNYDGKFLDNLLEGCTTTSDIHSKLTDLKKQLVERALNAELELHLGYSKHQPRESNNSRNGRTNKNIILDSGEQININAPRDRDSSFEPQLVRKHQRRLGGFDDRIIALYARGMSTRDIKQHIEEFYCTEVSAELISEVTDQVHDEIKTWQNRALDSHYAIVYLDAIVLKIRDEGKVINKALQLAIGVNMEGKKEILGFWLTKNESSKFWLGVLNELKNRGVQDIFIACIDGLSGFTEAIQAAFPNTVVQRCIVHMIRNSLKYVSYKDYKAVTSDLKPIYKASNAVEAEEALKLFQQKWDGKYPTIADSWRRAWAEVIPFLDYPPFIRKAIYTTNAIESANRQIRKVIKSKGCFPSDEAALKLVFLALRNAEKKWTMSIKDWAAAYQQFAIMFAERWPVC